MSVALVSVLVLCSLPSAPVEAVQRHPELVLEGPSGDGFLETSIPVPAPRSGPGCVECV